MARREAEERAAAERAAVEERAAAEKAAADATEALASWLMTVCMIDVSVAAVYAKALVAVGINSVDMLKVVGEDEFPPNFNKFHIRMIREQEVSRKCSRKCLGSFTADDPRAAS